jgi:hypothetical protein
MKNLGFASAAELYHYTSAAGLQGILENQELWATNIDFLNDTEERVGFLDKRLPHLLEVAIDRAIERNSTLHSSRFVEALSSNPEVRSGFLRDIRTQIRSQALSFDETYTISFCHPPVFDPNDGLLSQWRGYGKDGGYAIVFDTNGLMRLLEAEAAQYNYQHLAMTDVEYFGRDITASARFQDTIQNEIWLQNAIADFVLTNETSKLEPTYSLIKILSCSSKHKGFSEEAEVRIIATPAVPDDPPHALPEKGIREKHFRSANGLLIPYIKIFGRAKAIGMHPLPITKIIVGPHPERLSRKKALEIMLQKMKIDVDVIVSSIPYRGY